MTGPIAQHIVAAITLPELRTAATARSRPLPMPALHQLPRDGSMLYAIGSVDASGRVANREIMTALDWRPGDRTETILAHGAAVVRAAAGGLASVPQRPCIVLPARARRHRGIASGDRVLLAAAPDHGVVIILTLADLDDMLATHLASQPAGSRP